MTTRTIFELISTLTLALCASAQEPLIITFNPPGAGTAPGQGTTGCCEINSQGALSGYYADSNNVTHSFLRSPDGRITTFDAPGAGSQNVPGYFLTLAFPIMTGQGSYASSINRAGAIAGFYFDSQNVAHGFLRDPDGKFTTFDAPKKYAGTGLGQGTFAGNINDSGVIAGYTVDANGVDRGFIRDASGDIQIFNAPGAGNGSGQGTVLGEATCLNDLGEIVAWSFDSDNVAHGVAGFPGGVLNTFDAPGAGTGEPGPNGNQGTYAWSINISGTVTAGFVDDNNVFHGYVRNSFGQITTFDVSGAGTCSVCGTLPEDINDAGQIVGYYIDANVVNHGFQRDAAGQIAKFDVPAAGTCSGCGTLAYANNGAGTIAGLYFDQNGAVHAFLLLFGLP